MSATAFVAYMTAAGMKLKGQPAERRRSVIGGRSGGRLPKPDQQIDGIAVHEAESHRNRR
jgi:hypothetical protein